MNAGRYAFGAASKAKLVGVHPKLVAVVTSAISYSAQDFTVYEGVRTLERQKKLVASHASKTLASQHIVQSDGFGHAVDLVPWIDGQPRWEWGPIYEIGRAVRMAALELSVSIRWGGVWDRRLTDLPADRAGIQAAVSAYCARHPGPDFIDGPHFELGR